jgi:hypothetical protein
MKQQIEKIIKKNLPEKVDEKEAKFVDDPNNLLGEGYSIGFNQALSQIDTSLIADEVLKVVVENLEKMKFSGLSEQMKKMGLALKCDWCGAGNGFETGYDNAIDDLLLILSPNKENKNNG